MYFWRKAEILINLLGFPPWKTLKCPLQKVSNRKETNKHVDKLNLRFNYLHLRIKCLHMKSVTSHRKVNPQIFSKSLFPSIQLEIKVKYIFPEIS